MFTHKDIENRSLFVINGLENQILKVSMGRLTIEDSKTGKAITKIPFPKLLTLIVVGHTSITTPLIEHCNKHGIPLVVMKPNFRIVFYYGNMAEANYLLRKKQYADVNENLTIAKHLIGNKINNQYELLVKTKRKSEAIDRFMIAYNRVREEIKGACHYREVMGMEGGMARLFFSAYFEDYDWQSRMPRVKVDYLNATLDIGYTMLFNYIEAMTRLFGFDPYMGVYHQLWFRRKSLICDLMEPFRCIIERRIYLNVNQGLFLVSDFELIKHGYYLRSESRSKYMKAFFEEIIMYKNEIYKYIQAYYRCFMGKKSATNYPIFSL